jgi:hypothetical protein
VWWLTFVIPATQEVEIGRIMVRDNPGQKGSEIPISTHNLGVIACTCHLRYMGGIGRRIVF